MKKIYVGTIIGVFGIKGELKVLSDFEKRDLIFKKDNIIYIDNIKHIITNVRYHKNKYLIEIDNIKDINEINIYRNKDIYINREELKLLKDDYLLIDLINLEVYDNENLVGKVTEVIESNKNPLIKVNNEFYIPIRSNYIKKINIKKSTIECQNLKELKI